ncbi:hypothetical protein B9479_000131 [Cryptococcus floricola]|uniref:Uncharacterized protein n=1 Tax=Cryptococcus floricola TaxID=2591691 RepID=A0A5D3B8D9_9TREE|nr:hypothetical protein B9479_000131 [Cryptococcus floricola]
MPAPPLSILQSLSPRIAVLAADDVTTSAEANGCRGLHELLRPWEAATDSVSILNSTLTPTLHPTFPLRFLPWDAVYLNPALSDPDPDLLVDTISSFVAAKNPDEEQHYPLTRSLLLSSRPLAPYETFNHPVGILFAVSTSTPDPLGTLSKLQARTAGTGSKNVPWLDGVTVLRFYVVVHDVSRMGDDMAPAHELLANVKRAYGPHSTLLVINSQTEHRSAPPSPDTSTHPTIPLPRPFTPEDGNQSALSQVYASALSSLTLSPMSTAAHLLKSNDGDQPPATPGKPSRRKLYGAKLTAEDTQRLAALVRELVVQSLIPWMEARIREWNEVYHANRRGITGRLFGAGRKLFGSRPNSPATNAGAAGYNAAAGYYPLTAIEGLSRRLADFAFMLRDYRFASNIYDSLRKDYAQDRAFRYATAATEMYGLCLLLSHSYFNPSVPPNRDPIPFTNLHHTEVTSWLEQAVVSYHRSGPASQIQVDALRITMLYYEAWKAVKEWRGVGAALVKGAGEADEVPNAVFIEEAAAADLRSGKNGRGKRRSAFHLVLAARRYETAGLKTYSRRCLERASDIYRTAPWSAAQNHIEFSLGRQAYTLGQSDVAVEHFLRLLRKEDTTGLGSQSGPLQDLELAYEQLQAHPDLLKKSKDKLQLPTAIFDPKQTRISAASVSPVVSGTMRQEWAHLEKQALSRWNRKGKRPAALLSDDKKLVVSVGESFTVELTVTNPLDSPLLISKLELQFDPPSAVEMESHPDITLDPYESRAIFCSVVVPTSYPSSGTIKLLSVSFKFNGFLPCIQNLAKRGKRLHATKAQRLQPTYAEDTSLTVFLSAERPRILAEWVDLPENVYEGEIVESAIRIRNVGNNSVGEVSMIWSEGVLVGRKGTEHQDASSRIANHISLNQLETLYQEPLSPGEQVDIPISFSGLSPGALDVRGLLVYSDEQGKKETSATVIHHSLNIHPLAALTTRISPVGKTLGEYAVLVEAENVSEETVKIESLAGAAPAWDVQEKSLESHLLPNQTMRARLTAKLNLDKTFDVTQSATVKALGELIEGRAADETSADFAPTVSLLGGPAAECLPFLSASRRAYRLTYLHAHFPTIPIDSLSALFPLFAPLELDLLIRYSISSPSKTSVRRGYLTLHALRLCPDFSAVEILKKQVEQAIVSGTRQTRTMYEETGRLRKLLLDSVLDGCLGQEENPVGVEVGVEGENEDGIIEHDFREGPCSVPINFTVRNHSPLLPVRYIITLPPPLPQHASNTSGPASLTSPRFIGQLSYRGTLAPVSSAVVQSSLWLSDPALVYVNGWKLEVETGQEKSFAEGKWETRKGWRSEGESKIVEVAEVRRKI